MYNRRKIASCDLTIIILNKYFPFTCKINKISPVQESEGKFMLKQGVACLKGSYVQPPNDSLLRFIQDTFFNSYQNAKIGIYYTYIYYTYPQKCSQTDPMNEILARLSD